MSIVSRIRRAGGRRLAPAAILTTGVLMAGLIGTPGTAAAGSSTAGAGSTSCPSNSLCLYDGTGFTGARFTVSSLVRPGTCVSLVEHGWDDRAHSAINTHSSSAAMFMNDDCIGGPFQVPGNWSIADLGSFTPQSVWVPYWGT